MIVNIDIWNKHKFFNILFIDNRDMIIIEYNSLDKKILFGIFNYLIPMLIINLNIVIIIVYTLEWCK